MGTLQTNVLRNVHHCKVERVILTLGKKITMNATMCHSPWVRHIEQSTCERHSADATLLADEGVVDKHTGPSRQKLHLHAIATGLTVEGLNLKIAFDSRQR